MVESYKKIIDFDDNYDAIIIGSGMGSLTTAALLAKEGKKVLVLERHYVAGGFTHVFKRKVFLFVFMFYVLFTYMPMLSLNLMVKFWLKQILV